jgi:O-antigen/teichoic acid export membrane protein
MSDKQNQTKAEDTGGLNLKKSSLIGFSAKITLALVGFAGLVFFYQNLGAVGIGIYYTILSVGKLINSLQAGIQSAIKKRVSEVNANQSEYLGLGVIVVATVTATVTIIMFVLSIFSSNLILLAADFGKQTIAEQIIGRPKYLFAALGIAFSLSIFGLINQFYSGIGNPGKSNWMDTFRSFLTIGGQAVLIIIGMNEFGLVWGFVIGNIIISAILIINLRIIPAIPSRITIERTASFAKWTFPKGLLGNIHSRIDIILLTAIIGANVSGVYAPALRMTTPATYVASSIDSALSIKTSGLDSQDKSARKHVENGLAYAGLVAIPTFFGALAMPRALMGIIFGPTARSGAGALVGLSILQILRSYHMPLSSVIYGSDRPDLQVKMTIVAILINLPLAIILINPFGLLGVVAATVVTEACRLIMAYALTARIQGSPSIPTEIFKQLLSAVVMFGIIKSLIELNVLVPNSELILTIVIGIGAVVYFTVLATVSRKFRKLVLTTTKNKLLV